MTKIIDLSIAEIKKASGSEDKLITIEGLKYYVIYVQGALSGYRLLRNGEEFIVISDYLANGNDTTFVLI